MTLPPATYARKENARISELVIAMATRLDVVLSNEPLQGECWRGDQSDSTGSRVILSPFDSGMGRKAIPLSQRNES